MYDISCFLRETEGKLCHINRNFTSTVEGYSQTSCKIEEIYGTVRKIAMRFPAGIVNDKKQGGNAMLLVAYPEIGEEKSLPVYVTGIGIDYPQESVSYRSGGKAMLLFSEAGMGEIVIDGEVHELPEGSAVYLSERMSFEYRPKERSWTIGWLTFGIGITSCADMLFLGQNWCLFPGFRGDERQKMIREIYNAADTGRGSRASALLYGMLVEMSMERDGTFGRRPSSTAAMDRILSYLNDHYTEDITLEQLCTAAGGLSEQYLCRLFKQSTGLRPMEYMLRRRISAARVYLESTDFSIAEVALRSGFHNNSYFYRNFRKFVGMSPLAYRQAALGLTDTEETF